jgi:hypothetical protein
MRVFLEHTVRVILFPQHMTDVHQRGGIHWARQFKSKAADAGNRHVKKQRVEEAAFAELGRDVRKASETHRIRVRMLFSIYEAARAITVSSFACQGFWQAGLVAWDVGRPMLSPCIKAGGLPGPLQRCPFEGRIPGARGMLGRLFGWSPLMGRFLRTRFKRCLRKVLGVGRSAAGPPSGSTGVRLH